MPRSSLGVMLHYTFQVLLLATTNSIASALDLSRLSEYTSSNSFKEKSNEQEIGREGNRQGDVARLSLSVRSRVVAARGHRRAARVSEMQERELGQAEKRTKSEDLTVNRGLLDCFVSYGVVQ